jgi:hypothetical protein
VGIVMADLNDRGEPNRLSCREPRGQEDDTAVLHRVGARPQQIEAGGQSGEDRPCEGTPQLRRVPRRRDDVDVTDAKVPLLHGRSEGEEREIERMLLAVEPLLLQDERRNAVLEQSNAAVMGVADDPQNPQGLSLLSAACTRFAAAVATKLGRSRRKTETPVEPPIGARTYFRR